MVAVIGPGRLRDGDPLADLAAAVGAELARRGAVVVTGGLGGVMAAACRGAAGAGGLSVGLLPGADPAAADPAVRLVLPTGLGEARDAVVVAAADAVVAVGGSWGTLAELALARRRGTPVVQLAGWRVGDPDGQPVPDGPVPAADPASAVALALAAAAQGRTAPSRTEA